MPRVADTLTALLRRRRLAVTSPRDKDHGDLLIMAEDARCVWLRNPAGGPIVPSGPVVLTVHDPATHKLVDVRLTEAERARLADALVPEPAPVALLPAPAAGSRRAARTAERSGGAAAPRMRA